MIEFADKVKQLAQQVESKLPKIKTEEATKTALVQPFIDLLGYDLSDPDEVTPEYIADVGTKKGEKVDYAILQSGEPKIFIECKWCGADLSVENASQLFRYFATTLTARIGLLTNGVVYAFYTDLDNRNKMDDKPFFIFNITDYKDSDIIELEKFSKPVFDTDAIISAASELKYAGECKRILGDMLGNPSEDFVKFFGALVYPTKMTRRAMDEFTPIVKRAFSEFIKEQVNVRLNAALKAQEEAKKKEEVVEALPVIEETEIIPTQDEIDGYNIVRGICGKLTKTQKIHARDTQNYRGVLYDDNNRKPICRLRLRSTTKYLCLMDADKNEVRVKLKNIEDIYKFEEDLLKTLRGYLE